MAIRPSSSRFPSEAAVRNLALAALVILFVWIYGRFVTRLYFALDDWIETEVALAQPLAQTVRASFGGAIDWSGYRPLSYSVRAILAHLLGLEQMAGYYAFGLGLHLANTLLTFRLVRRVARDERGVLWGFLAAAIVLLLPSHNEAVLYMSASANLLGLFFCLLALESALTAQAGGSRWAQACAVISVALAALAYEVTISLPILILFADWSMDRSALRKRGWMYVGMAAAVAAALALRVWTGGGEVATARADYGLSFSPIHLARGYLILLGQMVLLHTSAWPHVPLYSNVRDWMSPLNLRALASMALALVLSGAVFGLALRGTSGRAAGPRLPFWIAWGALWVVLMGLPFAALAGRLPENRYTTIPSFGFAVAVTALAAWIVRRAEGAGRMRWSRLAWAGVLGCAVALLTFYAYVDTSDAAEWERSAVISRSFLDGMSREIPLAAPTYTVAEVGVPGNVGSAYVFTTDESFSAAVRLRSGGVTTAVLSGDLALRDAIGASPQRAAETVLLGYDRATHTTRRVMRALLCAGAAECRAYEFAQPDPTSADPPWEYAQIYNPIEGSAGGLGLLVEPGERPFLRSCWAFADLTRFVVDPAGFDEAATHARCAAALDALAASGALAAPKP